MGELITLTHIDLAVHFDSTQSITACYPVSPERNMRLQRCRTRLLEIASNPQAVVFYFSAYFEEDNGKLQRGDLARYQPAYLQDAMRILEYQALLGKRFFLRPDFDDQIREHLTSLLQSRSFTFNRQNTTLLAYGEFTDLCVTDTLEVVQEALGLDPKNCSIEENLSRSSGIIN